MVTKIYYSVQNGGDGSAYPRLMESRELAELDQDYMNEGWGENCSGCFVVESESPIIVRSVSTVKDCIKETKEEMEYASEGYKKYLTKKLEALNKLKGN